MLIYKVNGDGSILIGGKSEGTAIVTARTAAARIFSANGNIIIAAVEDGEATVYDFTGRLIKNISVEAGDNTKVPILPGCYIVKTETTTQSVIVK